MRGEEGTVGETTGARERVAAQEVVEGAVLVAEAQSTGRGRAGKSWYSPPGLNLYLSVIVRPAVEVQRAAQLSLISSLAIADAIAAEGGQAQVKWPNDVLLSNKEEVSLHVSASQIKVVRRPTELSPGGRMVSTGQGAVRTMRSATLPMTRWLRPVRPCVAMTIRSTCSVAAVSRIF